MQLNIQPVGVVRSPITDREAPDTRWGSVVSEILIDEPLAPGLQGIENWSHVVVIFIMHEVEFNPAERLVFHPGDRNDLPEVGVFAQRSRYYPNSIGLTAAKIQRVDGNVLTVKGLDAIDGTPVLAIKPYAPVFDGVYDPSVPVWFLRWMQD
jgi:tRNA-Thr(GGU) m(6)t(6)A37 methyltransferase TsaA